MDLPVWLSRSDTMYMEEVYVYKHCIQKHLLWHMLQACLHIYTMFMYIPS